MHLVGLALHPAEETAHAVPQALFPQVLAAAPLRGTALPFLAFEHPLLIALGQIVEWRLHINFLSLCAAHHVALTVCAALGLERFHAAVGETQRAVGNRALEIDRDRAAEPAARRARAERMIESEQARRGRSDVHVAVCAMPAGAVRMPEAGVRMANRELATAEPERVFDGLGEPRAAFLGNGHAILNHLDDRWQTLCLRRFVGAQYFAIEPHTQIALLLEKGEEVRGLRSRGRRHTESHEHRSAIVLLEDMLDDALRRLGFDLALTLRAARRRDAREKELQVIIDLRHRADGRARALHVVRLLDGDGRRDAADFVHARLVHSVQKLPRVGRERLDVTPLPFRVDRVECERRLAAAARPGDDDQFSQRQIEIEALEVVLPRTSHLDAIGAGCDGECWAFFGHRKKGRAMCRHVRHLATGVTGLVRVCLVGVRRGEVLSSQFSVGTIPPVRRRGGSHCRSRAYFARYSFATAVE